MNCRDWGGVALDIRASSVYHEDLVSNHQYPDKTARHASNFACWRLIVPESLLFSQFRGDSQFLIQGETLTKDRIQIVIKIEE